MARVICNSENASDCISGVKFFPLEDGRKISDEISDELAAEFASIPCYELDAEDADPAKAVVKQPPAPTKTKAQLKAEKAAASKAAATPAAPAQTAAPAAVVETAGTAEAGAAAKPTHDSAADGADDSVF